MGTWITGCDLDGHVDNNVIWMSDGLQQDSVDSAKNENG